MAAELRERGEAAATQQNKCTCGPSTVVHGFCTATSTPDRTAIVSVCLSADEHGAHEALIASEEYCYGDA